MSDFCKLYKKEFSSLIHNNDTTSVETTHKGASIIKRKMYRQAKRRRKDTSSNGFTVCVESADKLPGARKAIIGLKLRENGEEGDEDELVVPEFPKDFNRGHKNFFTINEPKRKMYRQAKRRRKDTSSNGFTVCVESADKLPGARKAIIGLKLRENGEEGDEDELVVPEFPKDFNRGHKNFFTINEPKRKMYRQAKRRRKDTSSNGFTVCVESADKLPGARKAIIGLKLRENGEEGDEDELVVPEFPKDFNRGHKNFFTINEPKIKDVDSIKIRGDAMVGEDGWNIDRITVTNEKNGKKKVFPVFTSISRNTEYVFKVNDVSLPQNSKTEMERQNDLDHIREMYQLTQHKLPDGPPLIKDLPSCEKFSFLHKLKIEAKLLALKGDAEAQMLIHGRGAFASIDDIKTVYGSFFPEPSNLERWHDDEMFGMQRLMSVNPTIIRLCKEIPQKLAVNNQMLKPFLDGMTLPQSIQKKRLFIIDYEILDGLPTKAGCIMTAPIALFFQRDNDDLIPIAIQLFQSPSTSNPVFLPSDHANTWTLAKMWFNLADSNYHESVSHLGFTHLKMEGIAVCMHRQIHKTHPVYKLLMPHFLYLIAINYEGIPLLLGKDGFVPEVLNSGRTGMVELIKRKNEVWRMNVEGTLPNDLKDRGVDDETLLPNYYYRNDAMEIYDAISTYVQKYLALYYLSDEDVKNDFEIQNWRQELVASVEDNGLGMKGVFGEKGKFTTREQVCFTLTSVIFTCSGQHAAVNFRQYEDFAYPPNFPLRLNGRPPKNKDKIGDTDILQAIPTKEVMYNTMVITSVLSTNSMNSLGDFEVEYITDEQADKIVNEFKSDLLRIASQNKEKNKYRTEKYWCLNPKRIPNSIST